MNRAATTRNLPPSRKKSCSFYKSRWFKNKGAFLILVWNFSAFLILNFFLFSTIFGVTMTITVSMTLYPLGGWLGSVYIGRYRFISWSLRVLWFSVILYGVTLLVKEYKWNSNFEQYLEISVAAVGCLALAGFQANILQFGLDQFVDASSQSITSYISWYVWIFNSSGVLTAFTQSCYDGDYNEPLSFLVPAFFLTLAVVSDLLCNHLLIKEPVTHNPLKLIAKVLRYAWNNKHPRLRSAFTYWDDKPYSRIELAKTKFGGPFTTEQVEDVKTFFRCTVLISTYSLIFGMFVVFYYDIFLLQYHYQDEHYIQERVKISSNARMINCFERVTVFRMGYVIITVFVPVLELVLYPMLRRCVFISKISIKHKFLIGMILILLQETCFFGLEAVGALMTEDYKNVTCFLLAQEKDLVDHKVFSLNYKWIMLSKVFSALGLYIWLTSSYELLCSQAPYSMTGLLIGFTYGVFGVSFAFGFGVHAGFRILANKSSRLEHAVLGCGVWYWLSVIIITVVLILIAGGVTKWYSFRRRDEDIHNEQIFAISYYEKYCCNDK